MSDDSLLAGAITVGVIVVAVYAAATLGLMAVGNNWISFFTVIPAGHVGIYDYNGAVDKNVAPSGPQWKYPFLCNVYAFSTQTQAMEVNSNVGSDVQTQSMDGVRIDVDLTVQYHVNPAYAADLYTNISGDYRDTLMAGPVRASIRDETTKYHTDQFYHPERTSIAIDIQNKISGDLASRGVIVENVYLRDASPPKEYLDAINNKEIQKQNEYTALSRYNITVTDANGEAYRNKVISESATETSLVSKWLDAVRYGNVSCFYLPTGSDGIPTLVKTV
jgi:regulator of protease activity HflC (stomatin/prohibitin superfamily)